MNSTRRGIFKKMFLVMTNCLIFLSFSNLNAQSIGIEYGIAGVENFNPESNLSLSLFLPFSEKFAGNLTYSHWPGEDGNYTMNYNDPNSWTDGFYFGNTGLNLTILFKTYRLDNISAFIGVGMGSYQRIELSESNYKRYFYQSAFTFNTILKYKINRNFSFYTKGLLSLDSETR